MMKCFSGIGFARCVSDADTDTATETSESLNVNELDIEEELYGNMDNTRVKDQE